MEEVVGATKERATEIIYEGTKYFSATKSLFHIALVDHVSFDTIELIAYEKRCVVEAPRIYLNYSVLLSRINEESIEARFRSIKEQAMKNHAIPDLTSMRKLATREVIFDFVLQRLHSSGGSTAKTQMLELILLNQDLVDPRRVGFHVRDLVCEKPDSLLEYEFDSETFSSVPGLSAKEKWRIPIVLAKVAKGRQLSECDSKIWETVSRRVADAEMGTDAGFEPTPPEEASAHTKVPPAGRPGSKSKHMSKVVAEVSCAGPIKEKLLGRQPSMRKSSFSVGLQALTSSLQRSLNAVRGISMDATHKPRNNRSSHHRHATPPRDSSRSPMSGTRLLSSPRTPLSATVHLTAPTIPPITPTPSPVLSFKAAAAGGQWDEDDRSGSRDLPGPKGLAGTRGTRGESLLLPDNSTPTHSSGPSARLTDSSASGSFSVKYRGISAKGGALGASTQYGYSAKRGTGLSSKKMVEADPYISPCERANRELKAARLMAKLNAASASSTELSTGAHTGANSFCEDDHTQPTNASNTATTHRRGVQFPLGASDIAAPTPRRARTRNPPLATQHLFPRSAMVENVDDSGGSLAQIKEKPVTNTAHASAAGANAGALSLGDAVLQPMRRLVQMVTRRSLSAVVPAE